MLRENKTVGETLKERGISRRSFLKFCAGMAAVLALPPAYATRIAEAVAAATKPVLVWLEFQDCAGNTESMLRSSHPTVADFVLDALSWEYHETLMAGAGTQAEAVLEQVVKDQAGKYIAVVEGSIPTADGGVYCTIGGRTALDIAREVCSSAAATIAVGDCAWDGGFVQHGPTGAIGVQSAVSGINVVNMGGCPHNSANTAAVLVHYLTFGRMPATDQFGRPLFAYGDLIHNQCERRAYYDAGLFAERWDDEGHRKGYCLYKLGCKGPAADFNCPNVRWNDGTSWPVEAGHGCIGCAAHNFWSTMSPFYERLPSVPGFGADSKAETIGLTVVGAVAAVTATHAVIKAGQAIADRRLSSRSGAGGEPPEASEGADDGQDRN